MQPRVTIGMPVYNGAAYIEGALAGIAEQSYPDFALLVSDNASDDGTWEILQDWAARDRRIVLHRQESNIGALANFRYLLDWADSEFFMWHAYDDRLAPNYLAELVEVFALEPECALACPTAIWLKPEGMETNRIPFPDLTAKSRLGRIRTLLRQPESTRFYGLFRTEALRKAYAVTEEFGHAWAGDHIALLPFTLNDRMRGTNRTQFFWRVMELSGQRYRPDTLAKQLRFVARYQRFHIRVFRASNLSPAEKLLSWPWLFAHASKTTGLGYQHQYIRWSYRALVKRPFEYLVRRLNKRSIRARRSGRT